MPQTEDRLFRVVSDVLAVPVDEIHDDTSPDTIAHWDSMAQLNLLLAIESEFQVSLSPEEAMEMLSVRLIRMILEERGVLVAH